MMKCTLSISFQDIRHFLSKVSCLPPLPRYVFKRRAYLNGRQGPAYQIVFIYEFNKSKLAEALADISNQVDALRDVPGFSFSADLFEKGRGIKIAR